MSEGEGCLEVVNVEAVARFLRERLADLDPAHRGELLHVLSLPDHDRADRLAEFNGDSQTRPLAELLSDAEEDPYTRAVLVAVLRDAPP